MTLHQPYNRAGRKRYGPTANDRRRVREAFVAQDLIDICEMPQWAFECYGKRYDLEPDRWADERFYFHADNGSNILAVAHLDHVHDDPTAAVVETAGGLLATSGALDDRLGAYVILEMLPKLGLTFDWLLTTNEEIGASTASDFESDKPYDWIIQFDRGGTDVVMYDYETLDLANRVERAGAEVGLGTFSDICYLEHLGCAGFNWGVGYRDYHGPRSHAWLEDTFGMVARFLRFHRLNGLEHLAHDPAPAEYGYRWWQDHDAQAVADAEVLDDDENWTPDDDVRRGTGYLHDLAQLSEAELDERIAQAEAGA